MSVSRLRLRTCLVAIVLASASAPTQEAPASRVASKASGRIHGFVLGPLGEPLGDSEVWARVWPEVDRTVASARTQGDGMFALTGLPAQGVVWVYASAPGLTVGRGTGRLTQHRREDVVRLRLWDAAAVHGRVIDEQGKPVPGAEVLGTGDFDSLMGAFDSPETRTDGEGRFRVEGVPIGDFTVRVRAPGFRMLEQSGFLAADQEVKLRLERGTGVRIVIRTRGLPAGIDPAPTVWIHPTRGGTGFMVHQSVRSGSLAADGTWRIEGLPDAEWNVQLESEGCTFDPRSVRLPAGSATHDVLFAAIEDGTMVLRGGVRTEDGKPLRGESLLCYSKVSQAIDGGRPGTTVTGEDGTFSMVAPLAANEPFSMRLVDSSWVLLQEKKTPELKGFFDPRFLVRHEAVAEAGRRHALLAVPAAFVSGRLIDAGGRPVPFQWTELQHRRKGDRFMQWSRVAYVTTGKDGTFEFPGVHGMDGLRVHAAGTHGGGASAVFSLARGQRIEGLAVRLEAPGTVEGRVLGAAGRPVPATRVVLRTCYTEPPVTRITAVMTVITDRKGRYRFVGVEPGPHRVDLDRGEHAAHGASEPFDVEPGATVKQDLVRPDR